KDYMDLRDRQMAANLKWLVDYKYPNRKVIVWAHNAHIFKNGNLIKPAKPALNYDDWVSMGHFFTRDSALNKQTYILGFSSNRGTAGRISNSQKYQVLPPLPNGFENWFSNETNYAFVDFKKYRESNPKLLPYFNMKGKYHINNEAAWTSVFDGIFYIKDMYPCDKIE
ncbi:MAG: erythromycin esterase family protein, partial [Bacteroidia bacterium]